MGNHRDAWGFGGSDPSSGTAQMLETARILSEMAAEGKFLVFFLERVVLGEIY